MCPRSPVTWCSKKKAHSVKLSSKKNTLSENLSQERGHVLVGNNTKEINCSIFAIYKQLTDSYFH